MRRFTLMMGVVLFVGGCTYAVSPEMARKADKTVTFEKLLSDPDAYTGKILVLGGIISQTTNMAQGALIEVVQKPLDYWGKPQRTHRTGGRFLVFSPGRLDALVYAPGREITVAAKVAGTKLKALGDKEFSDPVLVSKELKLWEKQQPYTGQPRWGDPLYDPYAPARQQ